MDSEWSSRLDEMREVVNSVSAAVPAPAHQIPGEMKCSFSQFYPGLAFISERTTLAEPTLSATIGPLVARVSAAIWT